MADSPASSGPSETAADAPASAEAAPLGPPKRRTGAILDRARAVKDRVASTEIAHEAARRARDVVADERNRQALRQAKEKAQQLAADERLRKAVIEGAKVAAAATVAALVAEHDRRHGAAAQAVAAPAPPRDNDAMTAFAAAVREQHHRQGAARRADSVAEPSAPAHVEQGVPGPLGVPRPESSAEIAARMSRHLNTIHDSSMAAIRNLRA